MQTHLLAKLVLTITILVFMAKFYILNTLNFVMDEFLEMTLPMMLHKGMVPFIDFTYVKPILMSFFLHPIFLFTSDSVYAMMLGRLVMVLFSAGIIIMVYLLAKDRFNQRAAWFAVLLTVLCSTEIERTLKIRTDNLSTLLFMISITATLAGRRSLWKEILSGIAIGMAILVTQKAIFFVIAMALVMGWRLWVAKELNRLTVALFLTSAMIPGFFYLLYISMFSDLYAFLYASLFKAAKFHTGAYKSMYDLNHFYLEIFIRDPVFWLLSFTALLIGLFKTSMKDRKTPIYWAAAVVTLFFFLHNTPWPYFFVTIIPLLSVIAAGGIEAVYAKIESGNKKKIFISGMVCCLSIGTLGRCHKLAVPTNNTQIKTIYNIEEILKQDGTYFDGVGMVLSRMQADPIHLNAINLNAIRSDQLLTRDIIDNLKSRQCAVIVRNYRIKRMPKLFHDFIKKHYLPLTSLIMTAGSTINFTEKTCQSIDLISTGNFLIRRSDDSVIITIDGVKIKDSITMTAGKHIVCVDKYPMTVTIQYLPNHARLWKDSFPENYLFLGYKY